MCNIYIATALILQWCYNLDLFQGIVALLGAPSCERHCSHLTYNSSLYVSFLKQVIRNVHYLLVIDAKNAFSGSGGWTDLF